jgi:hypothetical protein
MINFINSPYLLAQSDLIVAKISAYNSVGWSDASIANTEGQRIETSPT